MKKLAFLAVFSMLFSALAVAKDEYLYLDLKSALNDPKVKAAIPSNVSFKFGKGSGAGAKIILKDIVSNKRTNGVGKSDEDSCRWALAAALKAFGERALKEGGSKRSSISPAILESKNTIATTNSNASRATS